MNLKCIGRRIKEKRKEKQWSQEVLAYEADLSVIYIGMIERGEKLPRLSTFLRIVDCLDATPNEILVDLFLEEKDTYKSRIKQLTLSDQKKIRKILDVFLEEE